MPRNGVSDTHVNHLKDYLKDPSLPSQTKSLSGSPAETCIIRVLVNECTSSSSSSFLSTLLLLQHSATTKRKDGLSPSYKNVGVAAAESNLSSSFIRTLRELVVHSGREDSSSFSDKIALLLLVSDKTQNCLESFISSGSLITAKSVGGCGQDACENYFGSATTTNVNVPSSSSRNEEEELYVLHKLKKLASISSEVKRVSPARNNSFHETKTKEWNFIRASQLQRIPASKTPESAECKCEAEKCSEVNQNQDCSVVRAEYSISCNPVTVSSLSREGFCSTEPRSSTCCWAISDLLGRYLLRQLFVFAQCSGSGTGSNTTATDQAVLIGTGKKADQSSGNVDGANPTGKNSQSSTSTEASSFGRRGAPACASVKTEGSPSSDKNPTMKEEMKLEFILKSLVAGGVAGMCAKTAVAPLDRMKILLQAHSKHYSHLGVFSGLRGIVQKERFIALYKGNGAQMVRIFPYAATQFTSFEMYKKLLGEDSHIGRFSAGSAAGVTAVALTYPLDTIRARLAFQVTGEHVYSGIYNCALHIFRDEGGVRALYRGFVPTVCGMIPYAGLSFYCFESLKYLCMKYFPAQTCKSHSTNTGGLVLLLYAKLICGGVAGAAAQTVSYPLDVTRRRMQLAMMDERTKKFGMGMVSTIKLIYEENGVIRGLYRGMSINYLRAIPMVAVSFSTYELVKQTLKLDTGLSIKTG